MHNRHATALKHFLSPSGVFISYSHKDGFQTASLIAEKLRNKGYRVFLDTGLRQGKFDVQLYDKISQSQDFVIIVTNGLLTSYNHSESWAYKEAVDALKKRKNILPMMCSDEAWPSLMPESLKELPLYQDIKLDQRRYFKESVNKLISYLHSYPVLKYQKTVIYSTLILAILAISSYYGLKKLSEPVCIEQANLMTSQMGKLNLALKQTKEIRSEWIAFYTQFHNTDKQSERETVVSSYKKRLVHQREEITLLQNAQSTFQLNNYETIMLQIGGISKAEIEAFHKAAYPLSMTDINQYINVLENYVTLGVPSVSLGNNESEFSYILHSINAVYYNYMALMVKMPPRAAELYHEASKRWGELPINLHANCTSSDYEHLGDIEMEKAQESLMLLGDILNTQHLLLDKEQERLDSTKNQVARIKALKEDVKSSEKELENKIDKVVAIQKRIIKECEFAPQDSPQDKWGKILRIANIMNDKIKSEKQLSDTNLTPDLTSLDLLQELNKRFDQYNRECPDDELHISSLQAFYNNAQKTQTPINGVLYIGTQHGEPHPILEIGDIIIKRNGMNINSADDFREAKKLSDTDKITFIRQDNGEFKEMTEENPKNNLLIGLLKIKLTK